jgi:hypothetical protein
MTDGGTHDPVVVKVIVVVGVVKDDDAVRFVLAAVDAIVELEKSVGKRCFNKGAVSKGMG